MTDAGAPGPHRAGSGEAGLLAALHAASFPPEDAWDASAFRTLLAMSGATALVDEAGGFVLARTAADEAEILTLAVIPEARRRGVARRLVGAAAALAAEAGATALFLEVEEDNAPALALYAALGFARVGRRAGYYGPGRHAAVLRRDLG